MSSSGPSSGLNPSEEEQLVLALQREAVAEVLSASRTYLTACFAIYAWDYIVTLPDEYRTMWRADRWTPVRVVFFINRYGGVLNLVTFMCLFWLKIDSKTCDKIHLIEPIGSSILLLGCQFLLGARVWVMWKRQKWVAWFFGILAICGTVIEIWDVVPNKALHLPPGLRGCFSIGRDHKFIWLYWIPPLVYDTTATVFVILPLISHWRNTPRTRLLTIFARDGVLYFVVVSICNLVNAIYFSIPTVANPVLNIPLALAFTPMMASRIVLHLRSADLDANGQDRGTPHGSSLARRNNLTPKSGSHNQYDKRGGTELRRQSLGRRLEEVVPVSYGGVVVKIETATALEKGLEPSPDVERHDEYSWAGYYVRNESNNS
ncbi:hypothetical protein BT69DRAFT_1356911 [Atractiella rhizophila]|nr:hypothetical protein BT69DRAFT_1356911 [Atractiella rhizophila]